MARENFLKLIKQNILRIFLSFARGNLNRRRRADDFVYPALEFGDGHKNIGM